MIKAIILEDEKNVGGVLRQMIESNHPDVKIVAQCFNVTEAQERLGKLRPDLVFSDIELGKSQTCFDLLKKILPVNFGIIFTTAYSRQALEAIRLSAIDYLLKPIDQNELDLAIEKFRRRRLRTDAESMENLLNAWNNPGSQLNKIYLPVQTGYELVTIADIIYCESINGQTLVQLSNLNKILINRPLKEYEDILMPFKFYRIHRSYLVNLMHVKKFSKSGNGITIMSNNANLRVSGSLISKFSNRLQVL